MITMEIVVAKCMGVLCERPRFVITQQEKDLEVAGFKFVGERIIEKADEDDPDGYDVTKPVLRLDLNASVDMDALRAIKPRKNVIYVHAIAKL